MSIQDHPILGKLKRRKKVKVKLDGKSISVEPGVPIAAALIDAGYKVLRYTKKRQPRGIYCAIGRCTDCIMTVDGIPNIRTCVTSVKAGMDIKTQGQNGQKGKKVKKGQKA